MKRRQWLTGAGAATGIGLATINLSSLTLRPTPYSQV